MERMESSANLSDIPTISRPLPISKIRSLSLLSKPSAWLFGQLHPLLLPPLLSLLPLAQIITLLDRVLLQHVLLVMYLSVYQNPPPRLHVSIRIALFLCLACLYTRSLIGTPGCTNNSIHSHLPFLSALSPLQLPLKLLKMTSLFGHKQWPQQHHLQQTYRPLQPLPCPRPKLNPLGQTPRNASFPPHLL